MKVVISIDGAPAIGDVRRMTLHDTIIVGLHATGRHDWPRYADAIAVAVTRGAEVRQGWGPNSEVRHGEAW